jgi:hypothetical protein
MRGGVMIRVFTVVLLIGSLSFPLLIDAADVTINIALVADDIEQKAIKRMYVDACQDRVRATPPQAPLGGCTSAGEPPTCTCTPNLNQYANALGNFLEQQLAGRYKNMLSEEARTLQDIYRQPATSDAERAAIRAACTSCPPFAE